MNNTCLVYDQKAKNHYKLTEVTERFCHIQVFNPASQKPKRFFFSCRRREETEKKPLLYTPQQRWQKMGEGMRKKKSQVC